MRILVICSGNKGSISPFIEEQVQSIKELGHEIQITPIIGKGIIGYIRAIPNLIKQARIYKPDIIHSHYGLAGLAACALHKYHHVITYHGSDINIFWSRTFSLLSHMLCDYSIFVEKKMSEKLIKLYFKRYRVIPCGVNLDCFYPINKSQVRFALGLNSDKNYCLFAGSFNNKTKNYNLA